MGKSGTRRKAKSNQELQHENERPRARLREAEAVLKITCEGKVDAPVLSGREGSTESYRTFVETMNEGAAMVTPEGTIVYSNRRFADMVKMPPGKVIGSAFQDLVTRDPCPVLNRFKTINETAGYRRECELRASDGTLVPVQLSAQPMSVDGVRRLCIVATNLTERKLAEERVCRSELQLRLIFNQIPAAVWTVDKDLRIRSASGSALAPAHLDPKDLIGKTSQEFFGTEDMQSPPLAAHLAALNGVHGSYEYEMGSSIFSVTVQPLRDAEGKTKGAIGIAVDITENKKASSSAANLAAIVSSSQDAIYGATLDGYITSWNRGARHVYGYSADEVIGRHVSITVPEGREHETEEILEKVRRDEIIKPFETVRRCKDGHLVDVSLTISAIKDPQNHTIGISAIAHDLSDRKEVEKELQKLSAWLLKAQDEARRKLARDLHDSVAQNLAAAAIELTALNQAADLWPENRNKVQKALKITKQSVREIRTFSYLLHPPLLDERGLISALEWYVEGYNNRSRVHVELDLPKLLQRMGNDVELTLFRIVQEALTNIHRHSGGRHAAIRIRRRQRHLVLSVSDDGHGMNAATLKKVQRGGAALGVGIAGMTERIRQLGGQLRVTSGRTGTTVTAILPIKG